MVWKRLPQAPSDDLFQISRRVRDQLAHRLRIFLQNRGKGGELRVAMKGAVARDHFVKHRAEGEDVAARVYFLTFRLLGRHVGDGAEDGSLFRAGAFYKGRSNSNPDLHTCRLYFRRYYPSVSFAGSV